MLQRIKARVARVLGRTPPHDPDPVRTRRKQLSDKYLRGTGVEIGALHNPLPVPSAAHVKYVDRMSVDDLRRHYPDLGDLVPVDILDDGETLATLAPESQDFVIANHMLEHCQDPIGTLKNHLRVLRPGGILYIAIPDKRHTFDIDRPFTTIEHLERDHREGPEWSRVDHFSEYLRLVDKVPEEHFEEALKKITEMDYSIHFHVWTAETFREFLEHCRTRLRLPFEVLHAEANVHEVIAILRKT
jgi:predicted SAM-dependent methyltransferase